MWIEQKYGAEVAPCPYIRSSYKGTKKYCWASEERKNMQYLQTREYFLFIIWIQCSRGRRRLLALCVCSRPVISRRCRRSLTCYKVRVFCTVFFASFSSSPFLFSDLHHEQRRNRLAEIHDTVETGTRLIVTNENVISLPNAANLRPFKLHDFVSCSNVGRNGWLLSSWNLM